MTTHTTAGPADDTREGRVGTRAARADLRAGAADGTDGGGVGARSTGPTVRTGRGPTSPTGPPYPIAQPGPPSPRPTRGAADGTAGGGVGPSSTAPAPARNIVATRKTSGSEEVRAALHERNPDRGQAVHGPPRGKQRPAARQTAVYSQHPRKPFTSRIAANSDPPRGKQPFTAIITASRSRPTSRQTATRRAANSDPPTSRVPRSFRARCALAARCALRARRGRDAFGGTSIGLPIGKMAVETI